MDRNECLDLKDDCCSEQWVGDCQTNLWGRGKERHWRPTTLPLGPRVNTDEASWGHLPMKRPADHSNDIKASNQIWSLGVDFIKEWKQRDVFSDPWETYYTLEPWFVEDHHRLRDWLKSHNFMIGDFLRSRSSGRTDRSWRLSAAVSLKPRHLRRWTFDPSFWSSSTWSRTSGVFVQDSLVQNILIQHLFI